MVDGQRKVTLVDVDDDQPRKKLGGQPSFPLPHDQLYTNNAINLENLKTHLQREGRLLKNDAMHIVKTAAEKFRQEPNLLILEDPITVCGDIHGQFFDLLRLLEKAGNPGTTQYLFLGDYVDRGCFSIECVLYLFAIKIRFPKMFWMLRGNHECRHLTSYFNFRDECIYKFDEELYDVIMESFDCLPISATINGKFLALHGGISPDICHLNDIQAIDRFQEVPTDGPMCDMLWADPAAEENDNREDSWSKDDNGSKGFTFNETRQCSYNYGEDAVTDFLNSNDLVSIFRAHEACFDGYKFQFVSEDVELPKVITIFSAPNYCDVYKNKGACIQIKNDALNIRQYSSSPHPYYLPNFMDVITWSMPFVAEKVCEILNNSLSFAMEQTQVTDAKDQEKGILKDKIIAVAKMRRFFNMIQEENENIVKLKALSPSKRLPAGILSKGAAAIAKAVSGFVQAKEADRENMKLPDPSLVLSKKK